MPAKRKLNMLSPGDKGKRKSANKKQERDEAPAEPRAFAGDETKHGVILRNYYPREISDTRARSYADGVLETPLSCLVAAMAQCKDSTREAGAGGGHECVVHWFRGDLRLRDNTALSLASARARQAGAAVVGLYVLSPQDLEAHVVSPAKVDFGLRSLLVVKRDLEALGIPLHVEVVRDRGQVEERVLELCREWGARELFANMEYEVDELRRDKKIVEMGSQRGVQFTLVHDLCVVPPGELVSKTKGKPFAVYTPWFKAWLEHTRAHPDCLELSPPPTENPKSARRAFSSLFSSTIPPAPGPKALDSAEQAEYLGSLYPAGEHAAQARLAKFIQERVTRYADDRNALGECGTSVLSVHFTSGTLSARQAVSAARAANSTANLDGGSKGIQSWISEVAWRDFYKHVLANWPYVCMSKPFKIPYSKISWPQTSESDSHFEAWKTGRTGYPIIDAAMRQLTATKYMHNRTRMVVASFLTKDLLIDWRRGERFFMSHLVDGDFASNNGGWGWAAGTGVDPQPYFRVFNPLLQSEKFDPDGSYIRTWVPELRRVQGSAVHAPHARLDKRAFEKLGYPAPIVDHAVARKRSIEVYKAAVS